MEYKILDNGCWFWLGCKDDNGYGEKGNKRAHVYIYELLVGKIPEGKELHHTCKFRACVNPKHLEPVTHAQNVRLDKGYLTVDQVNYIRVSNLNHRELSQELKISSKVIYDAKYGNTYRDTEYIKPCKLVMPRLTKDMKDIILDLKKEKPHLSVYAIEEMTGVSKSSVHRILGG
jgi:hypothetical protein